MNSKLRSDSVFAQLTNEQLELLEDWLFEEKLGYKDVLAKAKAEWNLSTSATSLGRFYRRLALQRSEERRLESVALCLEGLAAKSDGTLQAGLLALANQCAIEFLVEQPKSIWEFTALLRALTSAGVFEMKHIEFHETRERTKQQALENERKAAEAREQAAREAKAWEEKRKEIKARLDARYQKGQATRKANLAAKKAEAESAAMSKAQGQMSKEKEEIMNNDPNPIPVKESAQEGRSNVESERRLAAGLAAAEYPRDAEPSAGPAPEPTLVVVSEVPTMNRTAAEFDGLTKVERNGDFTINRAGNPEKPLKTR